MNRKQTKKPPKKRLLGTKIGAELLLCVFGSLCISILLFGGLYFLSTWVAEKYSSTLYASSKLSEFQSYVDRNRLSVDDFSKLTAWINKNDIKFMHIYRGSDRIFNSDDPVDDSYSYDERERDYYWDHCGISFIKTVEYVRKKPFADGGKDTVDPVDTSDTSTASDESAPLSAAGGTAQESLPSPDESIASDPEPESGVPSDETEPSGVTGDRFPYPVPGDDPLDPRDDAIISFDDLYDEHITYETLNVFIAVGTDLRLLAILLFASAFLCLLVFAILILRFSGARVMYLSDLSWEVAQIEGGQIEKSVTVKGADEIATLARNVDDMRIALVERLQSEKEAYDANRELITAMSHDLRTPLSALIGYLEIISGGVYSSEEQKETYLKKTLEKAYQLKAMSDKLFDYFTVFKNDGVHATALEEYDGHELLTQMISEQTYMLEEKGFTIAFEGFEPGADSPEPYRLTLDSEALLRVFDNIYSNILKYADPSEPVRISLQSDENNAKVTVSNRVNADALKVASTKIGLKSCRRLMIHMNGTLKTKTEDGIYSVTLILKKTPEDTDE